MTRSRRHLAAIGTAAVLALSTGCGADTGVEPVTGPAASNSAPSTAPTPTQTPTPSATPTPRPTSSATATATATATASAALRCPSIMAVVKATEGILNEETGSTATMCGYKRGTGTYTASIQSEEAVGAKSLKAYRKTMRKANGTIAGIRTKIQDRRDFTPGAFLLTITGKVSGSITSMVVPRPEGAFAIISVSELDDGVLTTDLELTEALARAFLDQE